MYLELTGFLEAYYVYFMYNLFKTKYSFHHPLEFIWQKNISQYFKHPLETGQYESKICPFGHFIGKILAIWIIIKTLFINKITWLINIIVWIIVFICSLLMNMNSFIYLIPIFAYEIWFSAKLARP